VALVLTAAPATEPLTTAEAKSHIRVTVSDDDTLIDSYIKAARELWEDLTSRMLITQTWKLVLDAFPADRFIEIPLAPLQSVASVKYTDQDGTQSTQTAGEYIVDTASEIPRIVLKEDYDWPDPDAGLQEANAVEISFIVGYGGTGASIPEIVRNGIRLLVGHFYENREAIVASGRAFRPETLPIGFMSIVAQYKMYARGLNK